VPPGAGDRPTNPIRRRDFITSFGEFPSVTRAQQRKLPLRRLVALVIADALLLLPQMADAQKNIKVGLTLPKDRPGADFINGMYERFKSDVETRTNGTLTVEIVYGGALGNPNSRMHLMRSGAIQMSDASDGTTLIRLGIRGFNPKLKKAAGRLEDLRTPEDEPIPPNTMAELRRDMARLRFVMDQIKVSLHLPNTRLWRDDPRPLASSPLIII
jgi:hypothetical protein